MLTICGKWKQDTSVENVDGVLRELGIPEQTFLFLQIDYSEIEITTEDDSLAISIRSDFLGSNFFCFKLHEEFEVPNMIGGLDTLVATVEDNILCLKPATSQPRSQIRTFELVGDKLVITMTVGKATARKYFIKAAE
ncbi:fatty acid-binding protein type 2-like [Glandiceps talaboti]